MFSFSDKFCSVQTLRAINSDSSLRLSVSESSEWVCTKTIFNNGSTVRGCKKTYTGISKYEQTSDFQCLHISIIKYHYIDRR